MELGYMGDASEVEARSQRNGVAFQFEYHTAALCRRGLRLIGRDLWAEVWELNPQFARRTRGGVYPVFRGASIARSCFRFDMKRRYRVETQKGDGDDEASRCRKWKPSHWV